ncbi:MAG: PQQ-binding-like beta-propeller repeat protein [bacterium]|nr:PQQ-binding-like beta-propeller repeat protein [bacterium]
MKYKSLIAVLVFISIRCVYAQVNENEQWPGFRGYRASGILDNADLPVKWNIDNSENIKWKTLIPGLGHSCPAIWGDYLFVTTAVNGNAEEYLKIGLYGNIDAVEDTTAHKYKLYCLDKKTGKIIWVRLAHEGVPKTKRHTKGSHANSTPALDGKYVIAFFGSEGLYCYNMKGKLVWKKDLGLLNSGPYTDPDVEWGYAASPIIYEGKVIVQCDIIGESFLAVFDVENGNEIWRVKRDDVSTWSSPTVHSFNGKKQIIVNGFKHMGGYDFNTGKEIWKMSGGGDAPTPTPVVAHNYIFLNNAHGKMSPIYVVKPNAKGDITLENDSLTNEFIQWSIKRGGAYMQTPLIYGDYLYNLRSNGSLTCFHATTGKQMYKAKLESSGITASGVASDNKLYFSSEKGEIFVVKAGPEFKLLAKNEMKDICMATPAISKGAIYFRTKKYVVAVGK